MKGTGRPSGGLAERQPQGPPRAGMGSSARVGAMIHSGMPALTRLSWGTFSGLRFTLKPMKFLQGVCFQELQRSKGRVSWRVAPG